MMSPVGALSGGVWSCSPKNKRNESRLLRHRLSVAGNIGEMTLLDSDTRDKDDRIQKREHDARVEGRANEGKRCDLKDDNEVVWMTDKTIRTI